ncbi:putative Zn finger protein [Streptomyces luteogriseus]|uniref:SWIM zinc finger family protein n=1 Tax=Streptomyces luteogriseus TaxID=68233 RepID=UPI0027865ABB|nr:SWIM zinc finger family protein [Streptomyces luteogriseus]MDQ0717292.1 putative Zn finger protein [Streptomyces luteogriseus]
MTSRQDRAPVPGEDARSARPADEARRALREARERAARDPARPEPSPAGGAAAQDEAPGPADAAREALRRAVTEQRGSGRGDSDVLEAADSSEGVGAPGDAGAHQVTSATEAAGAAEGGGGQEDTTATGVDSGSEGAGAPHIADARADTPAAVNPEPRESGDPRTSPEETTPAGAAPARSAGRAGTEPRAADVAREALRAARDDARRAREATEREGARRRRRARQSAVDDRAAAARRAGADASGRGARDVRQLLSDAFRMPSLSDATSDDHERTTGQEGRSARMTDLLHGPAAPSPDAPHSGHDLAEPTSETPHSGHDLAGSSPDAPDSVHDLAAPSPDAPDSGHDLAEPTSETPHSGHDLAGSSPETPHSAGSPEPRPETSAAPTTGTGHPALQDPAPTPHSNGRADQDLAPIPHHDAPPTTFASQAPRSARSPRSMAAPSRDTELRRTFPPLPPREGDRFAESWWGNAWVEALEQSALDVKRLERGRGYAGQGHVDAITVTPGLVLAYVQGSRPRPYRVQVRLRTLDDTDWDRFLDAAADRPGHIAALLDKEMPQSLAECGVPLLPGPGDLEPRCSCPDRGHPCKHAAALCYQTARLLDADPFVLLLLRGRGERELLDALSRLSATRAARAAQDRGPAPLPGVRAAEVLASRALPPLPAPLPPPAHPEQPPAYPAAPGGPDPFALDQLATDAAARAHALLSTGRDPVGQLTFWQDAVRLAAARPGAGLTAGTRALYSSLAAAAGRTPSELARAVAAWRQGGLEGLAVLEEPWDPPAGRFDRARPLLLAADLPAFRPRRNHLTHPQGHVQLRLGRDGLWYAYESEPGHDDWWPRGTPDLDPVGALTGLGLPGDL